MKSIKRDFNKVVENNPDLSSYVCFAKTIEGRRFTRSTTLKWFNILVDRKDYLPSEKRPILKYMFNTLLKKSARRQLLRG